MKIAFTHNLKLSDAEEDAEFDTPETVEAIRAGLTSLGHEVELVEVSGAPSRAIARLESLAPDLVFNTAEGRYGRYREAFWPGIFEQLGLPFTGSDAYVCTLTLDKQLTKNFLSHFKVPTPDAVFVTELDDIRGHNLRFPVILKPNFEGSSKGITQDSIVEEEAALEIRLRDLLLKYPSGILVEEFIAGRDVTVPFLELGVNRKRGILTPAEYVIAEEFDKNRKYQIYDYSLKNQFSHFVDVRVPAELETATREKLLYYANIVFQELRIRDLGRADFRITPTGEIFFIEVNALPSLEPGAGIYLSARESGFAKNEDVLAAVVKSAERRHRIKPKSRRFVRRPENHLRVGFTYNEKRILPQTDPRTDMEAEFDAAETLDAIRGALTSLGHEVVNLEATPDLVTKLAAADIDIVFNIAEGLKGRNREAQIPAMLEFLDIPYTGSDPATLAVTLDKTLAKRVVRQAGVPTANFCALVTGREKIPPLMRYPLFVKPSQEGSSKGVFGHSVVHSEAELRALAQQLIERYRQPVLVEEYLSGREFTIALLGERRLRVLPPMEIVFTKPGVQYPVYSYETKLDVNEQIRYEAPAQVDERLRNELEQVARGAFQALGCRDLARIDLRLDRDGRVNFIECNPLPGLTPGWSDLCLIAEASGMSYRDLIGEIMTPAVRRLREKRRSRTLALALAPPEKPEVDLLIASAE